MSDLTIQITLTARNATDRAARQAERNMERLQRRGSRLSRLDIANRAARDVNELSANLSRTGNQLNRFGRRGRQAFAEVLTPTIAYGKAIAEVGTLTAGGVDDQKEIRKETQALAEEFGGLPTDQAAALYQAISAGAQLGADSTMLLTTANRLAVGGVTDVETAVDGLTTVQNAYGRDTITAAQVSDSLFVTMKQGKTTVGELSSNLGKVVPIASALGVNIDEVGASMAALTSQGLNTAQASTALRGALSGVLKPSKGARKEARRLGIDFDNASKDFPDFIAGLRQMRESGRLNEKQLAKLFPNVRALGAVITLTGKGNENFNDTLDLMAAKSGATEEAYGKMGNTLAQRSKRAEAQIELLKIQVGEQLAPAFVDLLKEFSPLAKDFASFVRENPQLVRSLGKVALAAVGLATVFGPLLQTLSAVSGIVGTFRVASMVGELGSGSSAAEKLSRRAGGANKALGVLVAFGAGFSLGTIIDEATGASDAISGFLAELTGLEEKQRQLVAAQGGRARERGAAFGAAGEQIEGREGLIRKAREEVARLEAETGGVGAGVLGGATGGEVRNPALDRAQARLRFLETGRTGQQRAGDFLRQNNFGDTALGRAFLGEQNAGQVTQRASLRVVVEDNRTARVEVDDTEGVDLEGDAGGQI